MKNRICMALTTVVLVSCAAPQTSPPPSAAVAPGDKCGGPDRFALRGDVAVDARTRLTWRRCAVGQAFNAASGTCQGATYATEALAKAKRAVDMEAAASKQAWRLPTIDELSAIADKACAPMVRRALPGMSGPPMWTSSSAGPGKVYQFDPAENKRVAEKENDAPGIVMVVR